MKGKSNKLPEFLWPFRLFRDISRVAIRGSAKPGKHKATRRLLVSKIVFRSIRESMCSVWGEVMGKYTGTA